MAAVFDVKKKMAVKMYLVIFSSDIFDLYITVTIEQSNQTSNRIRE